MNTIFLLIYLQIKYNDVKKILTEVYDVMKEII